MARASPGAAVKSPKRWHQGVVTWQLRNLAADPASVDQLTICAVVNREGTYVNRARITSQSTTDPNPDNNEAATTFTFRPGNETHGGPSED